MPDIIPEQLLYHVPQHDSENVEARAARPNYSAKAALDTYIRLREHIICRRGVEPGQHRADEGGQ